MSKSLIVLLFLGLTLLAGFTLGSIEQAIINVVAFVVFGFLFAVLAGRRFGKNGFLFAMAAAFFVSLIWPYLLVTGTEECEGDDCPATGVYMVAPMEQSE